MKYIGIFCVAAILIVIVDRIGARWFAAPEVTRAPWVETLATLGTREWRQRELPPWDQFSREDYTDFDALLNANNQKKKLYEMFKSGKGCFGLKRRYSTVEGDWIYEWLIVEDGNMTVIQDSTRDGGFSPSAVYIYVPKTVLTGFYKNGEFVEGEPSSEDSPIRVVQLDVGRSRSIEFY